MERENKLREIAETDSI